MSADDDELPGLDDDEHQDDGTPDTEGRPTGSTATRTRRTTRTRKRRSDAGKPRGARTAAGAGAAGSAANAKLAAQLCEPIARLATGVAFVAPTMSAVLLDRGDRTAKALVNIAAGRPRMLAALRRTTQAGDASELAETGFRCLIALALDVGRIPLDHPLAMVTGTTAMYREVHPEPETPFSSNGHTPPGPPPMAAPYLPTDPQHPMYSFGAGQGAGARNP